MKTKDIVNGIDSAARLGETIYENIVKPIAALVTTVAEVDSSKDEEENNEEKTFAGIPLSKLDDMAKETYRGDGVEIEGDVLKFQSHSKSGKTKGKMSFYIDKESGELEKPVFEHYPGQYCSPAELFFEKLEDEIEKNNS